MVVEVEALMLPLFDDVSDDERAIVETLHAVEGWPADWGKDLVCVRRWTKLYPEIDVYEEAVRWAAWMTEHESRKKIKHRARFGNWLQKAAEFKRREIRRRGHSHSRAEQEGHGDRVEARRDW